MEIADLKYFLTVAECENVNQAAANLLVAPSTLSKSIARLESELEVRLFERIGKSIQITEHGKFLQKKAFEIVSQEEATRLAFSGGKHSFQVKICGEELLFEKYGILFMREILSLYPKAQFQLIGCSTEMAQRKIEYGEAHVAITTQPFQKKMTTKVLDSVSFKTYVGPGHPLYKKANKELSVKEVLMFPFVMIEESIFGSFKQSSDGWRDDKFPRQIGFKTSNVNVLTGLVEDGLAIAYLPSYIGDYLGLTPLKISDCPFECKQKIYLHAMNPKDVGWLNQVW